MAFTRGAPPIWIFRDQFGQPLDDSYYCFFLSNTVPYIPQDVYSTPNGTVWANPLQFDAAGQLPNNLYFIPGIPYRIEVRQGNSQSDPLVGVPIENYFASGSNTPTPPSDAVVVTDNQITNPQFVEINFDDTQTLVATGANLTVNFAPGWDFVGEGGAGSTGVSINRVAIQASDNTVTNPPYAIQITTTGATAYTKCYIRQRFARNSALWANAAVGTSLTAKSASGVPFQIREFLVYFDSPASQEFNIANFNLTSEYDIYARAAATPIPLSTQSAPDAYTEYRLEFDFGSNIFLTSVQLTGQDVAVATNYDQDSVERQLDHFFHLYRDSIIIQPKNSLTVGWNFPQNPYQFITTAQTNVATNRYIADQTIAIQQNYVATGVGDHISSGRGLAAQNSPLNIAAVTNTSQFGLLQYIDSATIRPYWGQRVSIVVRAKITTTNNTTARLKARLIYRGTSVPTVTQTEPVASWAAASDPVFAGGWTSITPPNDPAYRLTSSYTYITFNNITLPAASAFDEYLGVLLYTSDTLNSTGTPDSIQFERISLVPNEFGLDVNNLTFDESLRQCQYYYEKSYNIGDVPGTAVTANGQRFAHVQLNRPPSLVTTTFYLQSFAVNYLVPKRASTTPVFYSPASATVGFIQGRVLRNGADIVPGGGGSGASPANYAISNWTPTGTNNEGTVLICTTTSTQVFNSGSAGDAGDEAVLLYHYVADARLGA